MKLALIAFVSLCAGSVLAQYSWVGPVASPVGGVSVSESGNYGDAAGHTVTVTGLDPSQWATLLWSAPAGSVGLSLNYTGSFPGQETMKFDAIAGNLLLWQGQTTMRVILGGGTQTLDMDTRMVLSVGSGANAVDGGDWNLSAVGGLAKLDAALSTGFSANIRFDARVNGTTTWIPYQQLYASYSHPASSQTGLAIQTGFYQSWDRFYSGRVLTPDFVGADKALSTLLFDLILERLDGSVVSMFSFKPDDNGAFLVHDTNVYRNGDYRISTKGPQWLRRKLALNVTVGNALSIPLFDMINGDIDNDNAITVFDYGVLSDYFDRVNGDGQIPAWKTVGPNGFAPVDADLDGDGAITVFDYGILSTNFDLSGD